MSSFEDACRPILFKDEHGEFPYWGKGSSFLIANSRAFYWVTASHVLSNLGGRAESLRIFPSDHSRISLPFSEQYIITRGAAGDEDYKDIFVLRVALDEFDRSGDSPLVAQDIELGALPAENLVPGDELWFMGYPSESNLVDYDAKQIKNTRSVLRGVYHGPSISANCHELRVESSVQLESYDGLSGGPVFYMRSSVYEGQAVEFPMLVGMLLRGTSSSQTAHFVSSTVLLGLIAKAEDNA